MGTQTKRMFNKSIPVKKMFLFLILVMTIWIFAGERSVFADIAGGTYDGVDWKITDDGELIIGGLPHETEPEYFNESDFITVNNYVGPYYYIDGEGDDEDEDDDDDDTWDGKYINFTLQFKKVFFYVNNSNISENKIFINTTESEEGTIDFEIGLRRAIKNKFEDCLLDGC